MTRWGPWSAHALDVSALTHVGRRENNEDAFYADEANAVFVVADGMGGYHGGEVASALVVSSVGAFTLRNAEDGNATWPWGLEPGRSFVESFLTVALRLANREVYARRKGPLAQMGSTAVAIAFDGDAVVLAHIGDSRIYRLREGTLEQMTRDHSLVEELARMGAREQPVGISHVITRAVGFGPRTTADVQRIDVLEGDAYLLCSDGLSDPLDADDIALALSCKRASDACEALVRAAYAAGGTDNITALVVRVGERTA
ncbi:MAG: PP2C family serine/threonine-protein phosphatase [Sandaracinaceae bacterium]